MARVAVTTAADGYDHLAKLALASGLDPMPLPCIEVAARADNLELARDLAAQADWLVITSARVVYVLWPDRAMPSTSVAAVGPASASAVERAGGQPRLVGDGGGGELAALLADKVGGRFVLFPHAAGTDRTTLETLRVAAGRLEAIPVYETRPTAPASDEVDAVVFGSPSAVRGWALSRDLDDLVLAAIGETTASALASEARPPEVMPPRPSYEDLFTLLAQHMSQRSPV